ncbi:MAG TPA: glycosyltransferase family 4 protein [Candidatus Acidoferrum sp.]|nr:glycosyltransferase family 4 protein [Candidatus Acidoferrum sp.]
MKVYLITPVDIKYSYKGTEYHVYEYAKYLNQKGLEAEILITENMRGYHTLPNYKEILANYKTVPTSEVRCRERVLPFKWHIFNYTGLPDDAPIYFPYSIYDYIFNVSKKPVGQKYIIGCHGMHLKMGEMVKDHQGLESLLNAYINGHLNSRRSEMKNLYCHVLNSQQKEYMIKTFKFDRKNVFLVPPMIDAKIYKISRNSSNKLKIIHIGGPGKDMKVVLDIVDILKDRGALDMFEFYFMGERDSEAEQVYKDDNVHFLGAVNDSEKMRLLGSADAMILPAYEVFPKTMLEGLASGLYIFTSRKNGAAGDVDRNGIKMVITKNGYPREYIDSMIGLTKKKGNRKAFDQLRKKNRQIAIMEFDKGKVLRDMLKMFSRVCRD